jgi:hypothetical protein
MSKIIIEGIGEKDLPGPVGSDDVRSFARQHGIKNMGVEDEDGRKLYPEDFPHSGDVIIHQVNKAGELWVQLL